MGRRPIDEMRRENLDDKEKIQARIRREKNEVLQKRE